MDIRPLPPDVLVSALQDTVHRPVKAVRSSDLKKRSCAELSAEGWYVVNAEGWLGGNARRSQDLFGIFDLVALRGPDTLGVQVTSATNVAKRVRKILESEALPALREAGWRIEVHGWRQREARWSCRIVDLS